MLPTCGNEIGQVVTSVTTLALAHGIPALFRVGGYIGLLSPVTATMESHHRDIDNGQLISVSIIRSINRE